MRLSFFAVFAILAALWGGPTAAAVFTEGTVVGMPAIRISGPIFDGDEAVFSRMVANKRQLVVQLASPGGKVIAATIIGGLIHERHFATFVGPSEACESACAIIWVAGSPRLIGDHAVVGFHAAFDTDDGSVSSAANAIIGAYYGKLGITFPGIAWMTQAKPKDMSVLTPEIATSINLSVVQAKAEAVFVADNPEARNLTAYAPITAGQVPASGRSVAEPEVALRFAPPTPRPVSPVPYAAPAPPPVANLGPTDADIDTSRRLARAFTRRLATAGLDGMFDSIEACYGAAIESQKPSMGEYCIGLDAMSSMVITKRAALVGRQVPPYYAVPRIQARFAWIARRLDVDADTLRHRGIMIARVADGFAKDMIADAAPPARRLVEPSAARQCARDLGPLLPIFGGMCLAAQ